MDNLESAEKDRNDREMALQAEMKAHMDMKVLYSTALFRILI